MTAFDYARSKSTAERLIKRYGQAGVIRRGQTQHACIFVVLDYSNREVDGARVLATDKKVLLSTQGLSITPKPSDVPVVGGADHALVRIDPLAPGGTVVLYELQCRR